MPLESVHERFALDALHAASEQNSTHLFTVRNVLGGSVSCDDFLQSLDETIRKAAPFEKTWIVITCKTPENGNIDSLDDYFLRLDSLFDIGRTLQARGGERTRLSVGMH